MRTLLTKLGKLDHRWVYVLLLLCTLLVQCVLAFAWFDARGRLTTEELRSRQENIAEVEQCYRSAISRGPLVHVLETIEGNTQAIIRFAQKDGDLREAASAATRLAAVQLFIQATERGTPRTEKDGRVLSCQLLAAHLEVDLELVGRNPDGTPKH